MRKLGDLIARHVPELARTETTDTGQVIAQTGKQRAILGLCAAGGLGAAAVLERAN